MKKVVPQCWIVAHVICHNPMQRNCKNTNQNNIFFNFIQIQMFHNFPLQRLSAPEYRTMPSHIHPVPQAEKGQEDDLRYRGSNDKVSYIHHQVYANDESPFPRSDVDALVSNVVLLILSAEIIHD